MLLTTRYAVRAMSVNEWSVAEVYGGKTAQRAPLRVVKAPDGWPRLMILQLWAGHRAWRPWAGIEVAL